MSASEVWYFQLRGAARDAAVALLGALTSRDMRDHPVFRAPGEAVTLKPVKLLRCVRPLHYRDFYARSHIGRSRCAPHIVTHPDNLVGSWGQR